MMQGVRGETVCVRRVTRIEGAMNMDSIYVPAPSRARAPEPDKSG